MGTYRMNNYRAWGRVKALEDYGVKLSFASQAVATSSPQMQQPNQPQPPPTPSSPVSPMMQGTGSGVGPSTPQMGGNVPQPSAVPTVGTPPPAGIAPPPGPGGI